MKNIILKYSLAGLFALSLLALLPGCVRENATWENGSDGKSVLLHLNLDIPGMPMGTRTMDDNQENYVDYGTLQVLLFKEVPGGEIFTTKAVITQLAAPEVTVKVPIGTVTDRFRLVVIANMDDKTIAEATLKDDALSQYTFDCLGRWSTAKAIPMWGESTTTFTITEDGNVSILMHRALARVDVGTLFKFNNPNPVTGVPYADGDTDKESVWGLDNFKIKEVLVYRTRNMAYAATMANKMSGFEVVQPNIPSAALFNSNDGSVFSDLASADNNPLIYSIGSIAGEASYLREIYIPESLMINPVATRTNVPCIVVGGYYGDDVDVTYYRADFATYNNGAVSQYRPILRNHRYVFDIRSVSGPGTEDPKEALNSVDARLDLNVVEWNEVPLSFYATKHYYFDIESRYVTLDAQAPAGGGANSRSVSYSTDLILGSSTPMTFQWETGGLFDVSVDYTAQTITFTALSENVGPDAEPRSDVLTVKVENLQFTINVTQLASKLEYTIDCQSVRVFGKYAVDAVLNPSHYIDLTVLSSNVLNGDYNIYTVPKNGIYFNAEGTFSGGVFSDGYYRYQIRLQGYGTLYNENGLDPFIYFNVDILSNSTNNSSCTAMILLGYQSKKILTIGANASYTYGYQLEPGSASRAFMDAAVNFGNLPESTVMMAQNENGSAFTIRVMTKGSGMTGELINLNDLRNTLNTFQPDIILTGQAINFFTGPISGNDVIELLNSFVDAGGVFVMCNEYYPYAPSVNAMVNRVMGTNMAGGNQSIGINQIFLMADGDQYADDIILNGPFGDMRGHQWGADGHEMHGFNYPPAGTIIYSTRTDGYANMFRHPDKGFFFMGEGGFISNSGKYIGGTFTGSYVYFPFAIDSQYRPIPRTNFSSNHNETIFNSQIFGNIMAWAIDYSEKHGIDYVPGVNRF